MKLIEMSKQQLAEFKNVCEQQYIEFKAKNLKLDMSRGKPSAQQLDLTADMLKITDYYTESGFDCRNYGLLDGIPEAKKMFAPMVGTNEDNVIIYGNSSLNIMFNVISNAMTNGVLSGKPWGKCDEIKFLCPVPGYDRHFAVCEYFGIKMINIPMLKTGPDMDMIEKIVSEDASVKGIWCVPQYSNPDGITYSDDTVKRFAALKPKADDFRIFWDNAYCIHHLSENSPVLLNILEECKKSGNPDLAYVFASTSKISFAGAGIALLGASKANADSLRKALSISTIGYDKLNQLKHVKFFKDYNGVCAHMNKHKEILKPKFNAVIEGLEKEIMPLGIGDWVNPEGGYFISFNSMDGCAKRIVELCSQAGVTLTPAGATYPYGNDPQDKNIRIAPTFPPVDELMLAVELFCLCVKLASAEKLLED